MADVIRATGLVKTYGKLQALDGLDLAVPEGTVLGLLGPNGAGKTTAVRILTTLLDARRRAPPRWPASTSQAPGTGPRAASACPGQYAAVDEYLTGFENLDMVGRLYGLGAQRVAGTGPRAARPVRPRRRRRPAGEDLLRRHAPPARPGRRAGRAAAGAVPGRADDRAGSAQPDRHVGRDRRAGRRPAPPCC